MKILVKITTPDGSIQVKIRVKITSPDGSIQVKIRVKATSPDGSIEVNICITIVPPDTSYCNIDCTAVRKIRLVMWCKTESPVFERYVRSPCDGLVSSVL